MIDDPVLSAKQRRELKEQLKRERELARQKPGLTKKKKKEEPCNGCEDDKETGGDK